MSSVANNQTRAAAPPPQTERIPRPLHVLAALIEKDLRQGKEAAQRAAMPYYRAAGEKLIEAKEQLPQDEFLRWVKRHFAIGKSTAYVYMNYADTVTLSSELEFSSLSDFIRKTSQPNYNRPPTWRTPVKPVAPAPVPPIRARVDPEPAARRELAQEIIALGYKAKAMRLHPDQKGSSEDMIRLNAVRDWLKTNVEVSFQLRADKFWR